MKTWWLEIKFSSNKVLKLRCNEVQLQVTKIIITTDNYKWQNKLVLSWDMMIDLGSKLNKFYEQ